MRAIILAAGQGTRLRPLTDHSPKCMVTLAGKPLLHWQVDTLKQAGVETIGVVVGYKAEAIDITDIIRFYNSQYTQTNMVVSLFCAQEWFDGSEDIIISYGDIVYEKRVIQALLDWNRGPISTAIDLNWYNYWLARMQNPLDDAETLKINVSGQIAEIGKKASSLKDIEGQYMGLIRINAEAARALCDVWQTIKLSRTTSQYEKMYMTDFLQYLIDENWIVWPVLVRGGWLEVDTLTDIELYEKMISEGTIERLITLENIKR